MIRTFALAILISLVAAPAMAQEVAPGTYTVVPERAVAFMSLRGLPGRISARMNYRRGNLTIGRGGRITGGVAVLDARSANSRNATALRQLRGASGLDVANHPTITMRVRSGLISGGRVTLSGDLTLKGVTRPVELTGEVVRARGRRLSLRLEGQVDRMAHNVTAGRPIYSRTAEFEVRATLLRGRGT